MQTTKNCSNGTFCRNIAFFVLMLCFALGAKAELYYMIYYDNPIDSQRHYVSISEDGNSVVDTNTFSDRCIWIAAKNELKLAEGGVGKLSGNPDTNNRANRVPLQSYSHPDKYLSGNISGQTDSDKGTVKGLNIVSSSTVRWLIDDADRLVLYTYYYNHYIYIEGGGWKVSSDSAKADLSTRAKLSIIPAHLCIYDTKKDDKYNVTLSASTEIPQEAEIRYTIDGQDPTETSELYRNSFEVAKGTTVKARIYCRAGSSLFSLGGIYEKTLPNDDVIEIDDREDHTWSYYQAKSENNPICSPDPRNVKITYNGNGGMVGVDASESAFVYYKTLEKVNDNYLYTTITNPFSKRPTGKGFGGWRVVNVSGGDIGYSVNDIIPAETIIDFDFTSQYTINCTSADVVLEAVWKEANIVRCHVSEINAELSSPSFENGTYETNFLIVNSGANSTTNISNSEQFPVTITMVEPDGSVDYRISDRYINPNTVKLNSSTRFEYIRMVNNSTTINANNNNLILGRGIQAASLGEVCARTIRGISTNFVSDLDYMLRIESGVYNVLYFVSTSDTCTGVNKRVRSILGCDYDRHQDNNDLLKIKEQITMGTKMMYDNNTFESSSFHAIVKSGTFNTNMTTPETGSASESFYISMSSNPTKIGSRTLIVEGGTMWNIAGGVDRNEHLITPGDNGYDDTSVNIRIKGGTVKGCIYGGGAYAEGAGNRKLIFTGGTVRGWIAAGCNGTQSSGGRTYGSSYIYAGGNLKVENGNGQTINGADGGQIFGAGKGWRDSDGTSGEMSYGTTVVIADNASVAGDVYGGGFYGYVPSDSNLSSNVYILGGTIDGSVYGGSNMKGGAPASVVISGGVVKGNIYGGSNTNGDILGTSITMSGGTVGTLDNGVIKGGNIFGGGNNAQIVGNTNVRITGGEVMNNIYGGGNMAKVLGKTNVLIGK